MMKKIITLIALLWLLPSAEVAAERLQKVELNEDNLLILSAYLDKTKVTNNLDSYYYQDEILMLAIEPLFEALKLKYQFTEEKLTVWKQEQVYEFFFDNEQSSLSSSQIRYWGNDGYFQFIDQRLLEDIFGISFDFVQRRLTVTIIPNDYQFPVTILAEQRAKRFREKAFSTDVSRQNKATIPITIPDQYRAFTVPHGEIYTTVDLNNDNENTRLNAQLVSDFLYHSTRLNLAKKSGTDLTGGITFSRYKESPEDYILGYFDEYSFGDIYSSRIGSIISGNSGVGASVYRRPENYRQNNSAIDIEEYAKPGWEAELFNNSRFITSQTVPDTGILVFKDVELLYGNNRIEIKLYGPYGEEDIVVKNYSLKRNPLAEGDIAYGLSLLDPNKTLLDNGLSDGVNLDTFSTSVDYGINDRWQVGMFFNDSSIENSLLAGTGTEERVQTISVKNYLSFPTFLLENEFAFVGDGSNFAQITSLSGRAFANGAYQVLYRSSKGVSRLNNRSIVSPDSINHAVTASYTDNFFGLPNQLQLSYDKSDTFQSSALNHSIYFNLDKIRVTNRLSYRDIQSDLLDSTITSGALSFSGSIIDNLRLSANLIYNIDGPEDSDTISKSSSLSSQYKWVDPWNLAHYFNLSYRPLTANDENSNSWSFSHQLAFETPDYRLALRSAYNENDDWSFNLNLNFFIGYDYHNNRVLTSSQYSSSTATLDVHTYLDRQLNGTPDVLDYDLENVTFSGVEEWENITSGRTGKIILPGVPVSTPFKFNASWISGTETLNQDYTIYTHPGARVDVNMPFYLSTELAGFIYRASQEGEVPIARINVNLIDDEQNTVQTQQTDEDGYYEFLNITPGQYSVVVDDNSLSQKSYTAEIKGFNVKTPESGGFSELPTLYLRRIKNTNDSDDERIEELALSAEETEPLVWDESEQIRKNLFTLPVKTKIKRVLSTPAPDSKKDEEEILYPIATIASAVNQTNAAKISGYSIQLGAFIDENEAKQLKNKHHNSFEQPLVIIESYTKTQQKIYRVMVGEFIDKTQAQTFASSNQLASIGYYIQPLFEKLYTEVNDSAVQVTPLTAIQTKNDGKWILQFAASKEKLSESIIEKYSGLDDVFLAEKVTDNQESWYCVVSQPFETKAQALNALKKYGVVGWATTNENYKVINKL
ncbi:SPOR domain-containing protein [Thalassotalea ganghwensis]